MFSPNRFLKWTTAALVILAMLSMTPVFAADSQPAPASSTQTPDKAWPGKVLFLGNSITWHPKWDDANGKIGEWGMAASAAEKDYVHIVTKALAQRTGTAPEALAKNIADFERQYATFDINTGLKESLDFNADLVILAIGENVPALDSEDAKTKFRDAVKNLLNALKARSNPKLVVRSCFWPDKAKDDMLKQAAQDTGAIFVDIGSLAGDESNFARSERTIAHAGIANHPGDKGMQKIADAILAVIQP